MRANEAREHHPHTYALAFPIGVTCGAVSLICVYAAICAYMLMMLISMHDRVLIRVHIYMHACCYTVEHDPLLAAIHVEYMRFDTAIHL